MRELAGAGGQEGALELGELLVIGDIDLQVEGAWWPIGHRPIAT